MFGIALDIKMEDFRSILKHPKKAIVGLVSQFILLPVFTYLLILVIKPMPSIALGMMLISACPGGNISNFLSHLSGSNSALSVSLTSVATILSLIMTPLNLEIYAKLYPPTNELLRSIDLNPTEVVKTILTIIAIPLILGILVQFKLPKLASRTAPFLKVLSIIIFLGFVAVAFFNNYDIFTKYVKNVVFLVFLHNFMAYLIGYNFSRVNKLSQRDCRTLAIETGIQNSGLGLVVIFAFFDGLGGMALVTGWWSIWHILTGLGVAFFWSKRKLAN